MKSDRHSDSGVGKNDVQKNKPEKKHENIESSPELLDMDSACRRLGISRQTLLNWMRLGTVSLQTFSSAKPGRILFSSPEIENLRSSILTGRLDKLTARRNKKAAGNSAVYEGYIGDSPENIRFVQRLTSVQKSFSGREIRQILISISVELFRQAFPGRADLFSSFRELLSDLIPDTASGFSEEPDPTQKLFPGIKPVFVPWQDFPGFAYLSMRRLSDRKSGGSYYTPAQTVRRLIRDSREAGLLPPASAAPGSPGSACPSGFRLLDPCCGSGSILLELMRSGVPFASLFGTDIDPVAVCLARINFFLNGVTDAELLKQHLMVSDFLRDRPDMSGSGSRDGSEAASALDPAPPASSGTAAPFDLMIGNPPWESIPCENRGLKMPDTCDAFLEKSLRLLRAGGGLAFVIPESVLTVRRHGPVRSLIRSLSVPVYVDYTLPPFSGVQCPAVLLGLRRKASGGPDVSGRPDTCRVYAPDSRTYSVSGDRPGEDASSAFCFTADDAEYDILRHMESGAAVTCLQGQAEFALGIVTGRNGRMLLTDPCGSSGKSEGPRVSGNSEKSGGNGEIVPVLRGRDLHKFSHDAPSVFLRFDPAVLQQSAPAKYYRAPEKLIYRFVGSVPVFCLDTEGIFTLNSANILIPRIPGLCAKYILAVLNSRTVSFWYQKKYHSMKLLRSHLEKIPIPVPDSLVQGEIAGRTDFLIRSAHDGTACKADHCWDEMEDMIMNLYGLGEKERELIRRATYTDRKYLLS